LNQLDTGNSQGINVKKNSIVRVLKNDHPFNEWTLVKDVESKETGLVPTSYLQIYPAKKK